MFLCYVVSKPTTIVHKLDALARAPLLVGRKGGKTPNREGESSSPWLLCAHRSPSCCSSLSPRSSRPPPSRGHPEPGSSTSAATSQPSPGARLTCRSRLSSHWPELVLSWGSGVCVPVVLSGEIRPRDYDLGVGGLGLAAVGASPAALHATRMNREVG